MAHPYDDAPRWSERRWREEREPGYRDDARSPERHGRWRDERDRAEVMEGGDRGWPGGVRGAEGGGGYGRGWFGEAYSLYAGRPEHEEHGRWERMGHPTGEREAPLVGRGPKGYRRSDERILDEIGERIARSGIDASEVDVSVETGVVTLEGTMERRSDKHRLEDLCDGVFGVADVRNHVQVRREPAGGGREGGVH